MESAWVNALEAWVGGQGTVGAGAHGSELEGWGVGVGKWVLRTETVEEGGDWSCQGQG